MNDWPKAVPQPKPDDLVQVLMTEEMAREFEAHCLGKGNTVGNTRLFTPLQFSEDDLPTYIVHVGRED